MQNYKTLYFLIAGNSLLVKSMEFTKLQTALTHKSFHSEKKNFVGNSRYVFLGMFAFKGKVADLLFHYYSNDGTILQHQLGNLFTQQHLVYLYHHFQLDNYIRCGENFDTEKHKHIFVYGLLGFIYEHLPTQQFNEFVIKYIIEPNKHLFLDKKLKYDLNAILSFQCKAKFGKNFKLEIRKEEDMHIASVTFPDGYTVTQSSKSIKYVKSKVLKSAILFINSKVDETQIANSLKNEENAKANYLKEKENLKIQKLEKKQLQIEQRRLEKIKKREQKKQEHLQQERNKLKAKAEAQRRKELAEKKEKEKSAKPMSANKRRHLEDKKK